MCMKKGEGPRCSHHTRAALSTKVQALKKVLAEKAANPEDASLNDKLMSAKHELYEAKVMYSTSPLGEGELIQAIRDYELAGKDATSLLEIQSRAREIRKRDMAVRYAYQMPRTPIRTRSEGTVISGTSLELSDHAAKTAKAKMFDIGTIANAFMNPNRVYPNGRYPGQFRVTGDGLCLVGEVIGDKFRVVTVYHDGVITPPRKDQLQDSRGGASYAAHYGAGRSGRLTSY